MVDIIKSTGERETFDKQKLFRSLKKAGAPKALVDEICETIVRDIVPNTSSEKIYKKALGFLIKHNTSTAARYSIKQGIAELGPAGFLFEQYVERLLQALGYKTERNQYVQGSCLKHEVDVMGIKDDENVLVEVKYRNDRSTKTHVDVVMYAWARLYDINQAQISNVKSKKSKVYNMWLVTNTKFTTQCIKYAKCKGLGLIGWNYPIKNGLEELVERYALYPVTVLPAVDSYTREKLASADLMLVQDIVPKDFNYLTKKLALNPKTAESIIKQSQELIYGQ